jgi:hypothetical protein
MRVTICPRCLGGTIHVLRSRCRCSVQERVLCSQTLRLERVLRPQTLRLERFLRPQTLRLERVLRPQTLRLCLQTAAGITPPPCLGMCMFVPTHLALHRWEMRMQCTLMELCASRVSHALKEVGVACDCAGTLLLPSCCACCHQLDANTRRHAPTCSRRWICACQIVPMCARSVHAAGEVS